MSTGWTSPKNKVRIFSQQDNECWNVDDPNPKAIYTHKEFLNLKGDRQNLVHRTRNLARSHAIPTNNKGKRHIGANGKHSTQHGGGSDGGVGTIFNGKIPNKYKRWLKGKILESAPLCLFLFPCASLFLSQLISQFAAVFPVLTQASSTFESHVKIFGCKFLTSFAFTNVDLELFSEPFKEQISW